MSRSGKISLDANALERLRSRKINSSYQVAVLTAYWREGQACLQRFRIIGAGMLVPDCIVVSAEKGNQLLRNQTF